MKLFWNMFVFIFSQVYEGIMEKLLKYPLKAKKPYLKIRLRFGIFVSIKVVDCK